MKNVTITLDERTAAWVRVQAAKQNMSVARFVGDILHAQMTDARTYDEAMRRFLSEKPLTFDWAAGRRPAREELWWDRLVVAAAQVQACVLLLTEDLQDGCSYGTVTVVNPFKTSVAEARAGYGSAPVAVRPYRPRGRPKRPG